MAEGRGRRGSRKIYQEKKEYIRKDDRKG